MKIEEIPQESKTFKDGKHAPLKVMYATNKEGAYQTSTSKGWETENLALEITWEEIDTQIKNVIEDIKNNKQSNLAYYMLKSRMDIAILAKYMNKWQWQIKRHLKPQVFKKLPQSLIQKYAEVFSITPQELLNIPT